MARGRTFEWRGDDGTVIPLTREAGYWIQEGVTGLGKPIYSFDTDSSSDSPGMNFYGARAASRQVFLPMDVSAPTRAELLEKKRVLNQAWDPVIKGLGYLYITDANGTYRLRCHYVDGMGGDESAGVAGEGNLEHWQRIGPVLQATDPYFELSSDVVLSYGYSGNVPFFPILPIKLNSAQVISDAAQPVVHNFFNNPSAENNLNDWDTVWFFGQPAVVLTRDASLTAPSDTVNSFSVHSVSPNDPNSSGPSQLATGLTVGVTYTAHCWVYVPSGQASARLVIGINPESAPVTAKDQWIWASLAFTATATTHRLSVVPVVGGNCANWTVNVDKFAWSEGIITDPSQYIDGDQANCHWSGTPGNSQSYRDAVYAPTIINNPGTVTAYPIWTIVGPGTQIDINDRANGRRITLNYVMAAGEVVIIDTANGTVRTSAGVSLYRYLSNDDFFPLAPGNSAVTASLIGAAAGSSITIRFKPRLEALV